jgi:hypothetical protein
MLRIKTRTNMTKIFDSCQVREIFEDSTIAKKAKPTLPSTAIFGALTGSLTAFRTKKSDTDAGPKRSNFDKVASNLTLFIVES